ncbi:bifunctional 2-polyprenyl-6-hydroxyphenol methylase/3-demethylubiquinol 3-O-methyltransferase UbiG [Planomicrobium sp. MB-3u-38]|uniref:class I SAM-dependent methyltransferase n=1 Tax=Planomicrobium sp. MB-3u-38 TaxID=2058318 RepID=UPI000C7B1059|nr:class I SAM-dependent methyltransferase [Planomicrobium sp. MB-3u-38]PKH09735.1 class I SAM-dependent methyltransferase [Planomicrobium sp. MB-3u-38]
MKTEILTQNQRSWNTVAGHFNGIDALPSYGPFTQTEEELQLFEAIQDKKVLDIGCGSGHSLAYMKAQGAAELWGLDFSEKQIETAKETLKGLQANLHCAAMEEDIDLPKDYFDIVYSIYAIGWTTDLESTLNLIYSYLKPGGYFLFSWDHPLYAYLQSENGLISLKGSYQDEGMTRYENFKGEGVPVVIPQRKFSTYLNSLIQSGFTIEEVVEPDVSVQLKDREPEISDRYYSLYKAQKFPTTMIIKARK